MRHTAITALLSGVWVAAALAFPQTSSPQPLTSAQSPSFDVATIKPNISDSNRSSLDLQPGGRFTAINVSLAALIGVAYGEPYAPLQRNRLVINPRWMIGDSGYASFARFDIVAKSDGSLTREQLPAALQKLLVDRFRLVVHHDNRELPIYQLVLARTDGQLGPKLRPSSVDCSDPNAPAAKNDDGTSKCGFRSLPGRATCRATMAELNAPAQQRGRRSSTRRGPDRPLGHIRIRPRVDAGGSGPGGRASCPARRSERNLSFYRPQRTTRARGSRLGARAEAAIKRSEKLGGICGELSLRGRKQLANRTNMNRHEACIQRCHAYRNVPRSRHVAGLYDAVERTYLVTRRFPIEERFGLTSQARRAAVSMPSNVAEGWCRRSTGIYINHVSIALGSHGELETYLEIGRRLKYLAQSDFDASLQAVDRAGQLLNGLLRSLEAKDR